jgi:predicted GIY-YIG superfamily endonuclease
MIGTKRFVYIIENDAKPRSYHVGVTSNVANRLVHHTTGRCPHRSSRRPWHVHVVIEFPDEQRALVFERYLKSGSGRSFATRHFAANDGARSPRG